MEKNNHSFFFVYYSWEEQEVMDLSCSKKESGLILRKLFNDKEIEILSGEILKSLALDICSSI